MLGEDSCPNSETEIRDTVALGRGKISDTSQLVPGPEVNWSPERQLCFEITPSSFVHGSPGTVMVCPGINVPNYSDNKEPKE
jgi:hypothetical protein